MIDRRRWRVAVATAAAAAFVAMIALAQGDSAAPSAGGSPGGPARTVPAARGTLDVDGGIVQLAAQRDGVIREIFVAEGQAVRRNEALAVIDDRVATIQLDIAEAQLGERIASVAAQEARVANARRERDRLAPLASAKAVSQKSFNDAEGDLKLQLAELAQRQSEAATAEAQVRSAEFEKGVRTVRAPSDGVVVRRLVRPGDGVSTLNVTPLFWFAPALERVVRVEIEDYFVKQLTVGQDAEMALDSDPTLVIARGKLVRLGQAFGPRRVTAYDPRERVDVRVLEGVVAISGPPIQAPLGQRVIVRFPKDER